MLLNSESLIFMGLSALMIFFTQNFGRRSLVLLDDLVIPIGIIGTLIGMVMMLGSESNPQALPSGIFAALTPTLYALAIKSLVYERHDFVELDSRRRCTKGKTIHGRETRSIRAKRAQKFAELKYLFKLIT